MVAIFPNEAAIVRLIGSMLLKRNDEWAASRGRKVSLEKLASLSDNPPARPRCIAEPASSSGHDRRSFTTGGDAVSRDSTLGIERGRQAP